MPWNPEVYNQFKDIRFQPFFDLMKMITADGLKAAVDIGCGTGEQTSILADKFSEAHFIGIDASTEMLAASTKLEHERLQFKQTTIEEFADDNSQWYLVFSNAALQWADNHHVLFPKLLGKVTAGGQFAVQMPSQTENVLNKVLLDLVQQQPFSDYLQGWCRHSPVLSLDDYAQMMFVAGMSDIQIVQKVYPIIATDVDALFNFISGSALIPYMEKLAIAEQALFTKTYKSSIGEAFRQFPAMYAFKRILLYGRRK